MEGSCVLLVIGCCLVGKGCNFMELVDCYGCNGRAGSSVSLIKGCIGGEVAECNGRKLAVLGNSCIVR